MYRPANKGPQRLVANIEALGIGAQQPFHPSHQIGLGSFDYQMKVIAHEAIGVNLPFGLSANLPKGQKETLIIQIIPTRKGKFLAQRW